LNKLEKYLGDTKMHLLKTPPKPPEDYLTLLLKHWAATPLADWLTILYIAFLITCIAASNRLFAQFISSKPKGRKTAIGDLTKWTLHPIPVPPLDTVECVRASAMNIFILTLLVKHRK